jgi:hypothetical protein
MDRNIKGNWKDESYRTVKGTNVKKPHGRQKLEERIT